MTSSLTPVPEIFKKQGWKNHRASVRYRCAPATAGKVYLSDDEKFVRAWVLNISEGGLALLLDRSLELGLVLAIQMKCSTGEKLVQLSAQVAHCTCQSKGDWVIGCEFVVPLAKEQLDELL